ncbi:MAG: GTP-binding protein [Nanoarchaeota archaeon]
MPEYNDRIKDLEAEVAKTKYNKSTQHHIGLVKAKIAKLKEKEQARGSKKGKTEGYSVRKTGDGTVLLLGFPSVGKSTLLNALTNANSEVAAYAFTTLTCIPGLLDYKHAKIQILDVPGIVKGAASGKGRGKEVLAVMRSADLALIIVDALHPEHFDVLIKEVYDSGIRLNQRRPDVRVKKTAKDGLRIGRTVRTPDLSDATLTAVLRELGINNAEVLIREPIDVDRLIDIVEGNKVYMPSVTVINKADLVTAERLKAVKRKVRSDIEISAHKKDHTEELKDIIFNKLDLIRLYLKEPGKPADMVEPLIVHKDATIGEVCTKLHRDFLDKFRFARVWGLSAKFDGQRVMAKHVLIDEDVLEIHLV